MRRAFVVLLALSASSAAHAAPPPAYPSIKSFATGSFSKTCSGVQIDTGSWRMKATCGTSAGSSFWGGKPDPGNITSIDFTGCVPGSIGNYDGKLACTRDPLVLIDHLAYKNREAFRAAGLLVMGQDPSWGTLTYWARAIKRTNPAAKIGELEFGDAALALRAFLVNGSLYPDREAVMNAAITEVWGPAVTIDGPIKVVNFGDQRIDRKRVMDDIRVGKAWFATLVPDFRKLKATPVPTQTAPPPEIK